ncbi:DUF2892 domain-containing protein [Erythrobacteraceae bacterium CFH 75059]|uniref:YgaP family membrane protein n=1 Tax=Qipengyuania thermophila TaxID=2509361 RepID=UPI0010226C53|nr:DUF2892 domain-containing protein [Qipengyuania thermophila]TCD04980.1 DUF2892 domain-containing protein [Erythrobacteraceae bacterium CFH 75059]
MSRNIGGFDRIFRLVLAALLLLLFFAGALPGADGFIGLVAAAVLAGTALVGFCPAYRLLGLNTCGGSR